MILPEALGCWFCILASLAAFGIGNMTQVNTIASSINTAITAFGGNPMAKAVELFGQQVPVTSIVVGALVALVTALVIFGGIKRIGSVTEKLVPVMAVIYIICALAVVFTNIGSVGKVFDMIFQGAFNPDAVMGGVTGTLIMTTIQKGVGRGVFSNEAGVQIPWGGSGGAEFSTVFGPKIGSMVVAVGIGLFALSAILGWVLYGTRTCEYLLGHKAVPVYQTVFVLAIIVGATLKLDLVWGIAEVLNGFMAIPNLIALLGLSGVVIRLTKAHFAKPTLQK